MTTGKPALQVRVLAEYNTGMLYLARWTAITTFMTSAALTVSAQTPQPFPRPGEQRPIMPEPAVPAPAAQQPPVAPRSAPPSTPASPTDVPTEATLGVQIYPGAEFVGSYDAGRGQRYYLFGSTTDFLPIVTYYKTLLKQKGELLFEEPPVHEFDIGKFKEESMAFPPSVTVKDYTWGGSMGYLNPKRGAQPARFKTIIQIVPAPPIQ
jgi:hypothetical protein